MKIIEIRVAVMDTFPNNEGWEIAMNAIKLGRILGEFEAVLGTVELDRGGAGNLLVSDPGTAEVHRISGAPTSATIMAALLSGEV